MNFKVGDVCYFEGLCDRCQEFNGTECRVISDLRERYGDSSKTTRLCHRVHCALDGQQWLCEPKYLRLKRPPSWDKWLYDTSDVEKEHTFTFKCSDALEAPLKISVSGR